MATYSKSLTVAAKSAYTLTMNNIPTGSSVTPVNDIQTWLHCADIWSKTYTTINQVLADASTLQALIASTNAVDYMVRSTNWASSVCANATAMSYIGNNDYCANKLLANSTWFTAICNSTYFESVLNVKVPTMTSNTTPSGQVIYDKLWTGSAYTVFDGNSTTACGLYAYDSPSYPTAFIGYVFTSQNVIKKLVLDRVSNSNAIVKIKLSGSNDGNTYTTISENNVTSSALNFTLLYPNNNTKYRYYKCQVGCNYGNAATQIYTIQFYGRA